VLTQETNENNQLNSFGKLQIKCIDRVVKHNLIALHSLSSVDDS